LMLLLIKIINVLTIGMTLYNEKAYLTYGP